MSAKPVEPEFKKEEVWAVARAIGSGLYVDERGRNAHLVCSHCSQSVYFAFDEDEAKQHEDFVHSSDCIVLIAQDLLTGAPK